MFPDPDLLSFLELTWSEILLGITVFLASFVGTTVAAAFLLVKLPAEYFQSNHPRRFWIDRHPVLRWSGLVLKNLFGLLVFAVGVILSMPGVPGPGILTILIAITLLDFPGKRRFERWLVGRPQIFRAVNRLRARFEKPPLVLDDRPAEAVPREVRRSRG
ncbi:MAG: hypothetical protein ACREQ9_19390 [Candidatus Binatia bacterium]